jgi:hypothetical protein
MVKASASVDISKTKPKETDAIDDGKQVENVASKFRKIIFNPLPQALLIFV